MAFDDGSFLGFNAGQCFVVAATVAAAPCTPGEHDAAPGVAVPGGHHTVS